MIDNIIWVQEKIRSGPVQHPHRLSQTFVKIYFNLSQCAVQVRCRVHLHFFQTLVQCVSRRGGCNNLSLRNSEKDQRPNKSNAELLPIFVFSTTTVRYSRSFIFPTRKSRAVKFNINYIISKFPALDFLVDNRAGISKLFLSFFTLFFYISCIRLPTTYT